MIEKIDQERMEALCLLVKIFKSFGGVLEVEKFLTDRKLNPFIPDHKENIKELFESVEK
ncbi:hypothetical protein KAR91_06720 [Candidatus Pacearchaeota archaeon]|nr:hypothetical protein [Candidatus Pacearchaeota archaeon]